MSQMPMNSGPCVIRADNISIAWARVFLTLTESGVDELIPLIVHLTGVHGVPSEVPAIRESLDARLGSQTKLYSTATTANLIFPEHLWRRHRPEGRQAFFRRYREIVYPRLRRADRRNRKGTYFQRMLAYGLNECDQLSHVIDTRLKGNLRRSAQQIVIFDPNIDHSDSPYMQFPCLDYLAFTSDKEGRLSLTAFYANHYIFDRAYGNYLGLWSLGCFVAEELGLEFRRLTCVAGVAQLGSISPREARSLAQFVATALAAYEGAQATDSRGKA